MKFVFLLLAVSAPFIAVAIPMQSSQGGSSVPNPNYVPKVVVEFRPMTGNERAAAKDMIINHYKSLEPGDDHKGARLAFAKKGWHDGKGLNNAHRQYLNFDYHRGDTPDSDKIGQTVTVSRDRPPPEPRFASTISKESKAEMAKEMDKKYKALPPEQANRVRSMRAHGDWADGHGLREETQMTFHYGAPPFDHNQLWDPVTIHRPMSFLIDDQVPPKQVPVIKKRIREAHEKLDENHPLKQANYGVVTEGWQMKQGRSMKLHVESTLYKVKDELTDSAEEDFERVGDFEVPLGKGRKSEVPDSSESFTRP